MGLTHFPNGISVQGVQVVPGGGGAGAGSGQSLPATTGKYFYVDSVSGSNANSGSSPSKPMATIDAAVAKCRANKGDVIVAMPNHAETITAAAGIDLDVAGITVVGLGVGDNKPAITFTTLAGADVDVDAADITIRNLRFVCNVASQTAMIDVNSTSCHIDSCDFFEGTATGLTMIDVNGGSANACDDTLIENCLFLSPTAGNQDRAIELGEVADNVVIRANTIIGDWDDAGIHNPTDKVLTNLQITSNVVHNRQTGQHAIELVSACTGSAAYNVLYADTYAATLDPGSLMCIFNRAVNGIDAGSIEIPASADNADNYIGFNNADNGIATNLVVGNRDGSVLERLEFLMDESSGTAGIATFPAGVQAANGVSMAEVLRFAQEAVRNGTGTALATNKSLVDALGTDGTTVTDAAVSVLGAIGADNANNAFASTLVAANRDGSVLERLEFLMDEQSGTAGIASFPAGAQAADAVSMAEVLRFAQEAVRNGTGTALATNKSLVDALGTDGTTVTDVAVSVLGAIGADNANNAFASTNVVANADGSVLERLEWVQANVGDVGGLAVKGTTDAGMIASTTAIVSAGLGGYGDDFFNTKYYMQIIKNTNSVGNAPEREVQQITDYVSATGTFTTNAFTVNVEATDEVLVLHESLVLVGRDDANNVFASTNVVANADGSVLERLERVQTDLITLPTGSVTAAAFAAGAIDAAAIANGAIDAATFAAGAIDAAAIANSAIDAATFAAGAIDAAAIANGAIDAATFAAGAIDAAAIANGAIDAATFAAGAIDAAAIADGAIDAAAIADGAIDAATFAAGAIDAAAIANGAIDAATFAAGAIDAAAIANGAIDAATFAAGAIDAAAIANGAIDAATFAAGAIDAAAIAAGAVDADAIAADTILGADNANNAFASTLVAPNEDGSLIERSEYLQQAVSRGTGTVIPANTSVYDLLAGTNGIPTFPNAAFPGDGVSIAEVLRSNWLIQHGSLPLTKDSGNYFTVTADFTNVTWNTVASHEIATVTGMVRMTIIPECTGTLTDAANAALIQLGIEGSTAAIIAATGAAGSGGTTIDSGELWIDATPADLIAVGTDVDKLTVVVPGGKDVGYEITGEALTGGSIIFHVWWTPMDATGLVVAGAGGAL